MSAFLQYDKEQTRKRKRKDNKNIAKSPFKIILRIVLIVYFPPEDISIPESATTRFARKKMSLLYFSAFAFLVRYSLDKKPRLNI